MLYQIYTRSLEEEFDHFRDFIKTFKFRRGKMEYLDEDDEDSIVGEFKVSSCPKVNTWCYILLYGNITQHYLLSREH